MRKLFVLLATILIAGQVLTASSPSLDGRAVVADAGEFPQGLFAKTVGYLPGDSINVTNPANGEKIDILVIGSLDPSQGIAIELSPEAAETLGIKKNSNNIVKLTKRSGSADECVYGSAVIADEPETPNDEISNDISEMVSEEEPSDEVVELEEDAIDEELALAEETVEEKQEAADEAEEELALAEENEKVLEEEAAENPSDEAIEEELALAEETVEEKQEEADEAEEELAEAEAFEEELCEEEPVEEVAEETPEEVLEEELAEEKIEEEEVVEEELAEEEPPAESTEEEAVEEELAEEEEVPEEMIEEELAEEEMAEEEEIVEEVTEEKPLEAEGFVADEIEPEAEPEEEVAEEIALEEKAEEPVAEETDSETYEAIVLVPSDSNPPMSFTEDASIEEPVDVEKEEAVSSGSYNTVKELERNKYYVQLAVYSQAENAQSVYDRYGSRYPVTVMENGARKTVLVGPLTVDEYGIVLERFKAYGFKDAFVKKGK